jgi:hypothetical protein
MTRDPGSAACTGRMYANQRTSVRFANPAGMKVTWQGPGGAFVEPAHRSKPGPVQLRPGEHLPAPAVGIPNRRGRSTTDLEALTVTRR